MRTRRAEGFTLLEIIVVVLVFSVMAAMAYGGLNSVLKTRRGIEDSMQRTADLQRAYQRLRSDFQNLRDRPARDAFGEPQAPLTIDRDGNLSLIRGGWRSPLGSGRSSLERVAYRMDDGTLLRASFRAVDLPQDAKPLELPLLRKVEELRWRFLDSGYQWRTQWPAESQQGGAAASTATEPPPLAVEITIVTRDWGEMRFLFRTPQAGLVPQGATAPEGGSRLLTIGGLLPAKLLGTATGRGDGNAATAPGQVDETPPAPEPTPDPTPGGTGTAGDGDEDGAEVTE